MAGGARLRHQHSGGQESKAEGLWGAEHGPGWPQCREPTTWGQIWRPVRLTVGHYSADDNERVKLEQAGHPLKHLTPLHFGEKTSLLPPSMCYWTADPRGRLFLLPTLQSSPCQEAEHTHRCPRRAGSTTHFPSWRQGLGAQLFTKTHSRNKAVNRTGNVKAALGKYLILLANIWSSLISVYLPWKATVRKQKGFPRGATGTRWAWIPALAGGQAQRRTTGPLSARTGSKAAHRPLCSGWTMTLPLWSLEILLERMPV